MNKNHSKYYILDKTRSIFVMIIKATLEWLMARLLRKSPVELGYSFTECGVAVIHFVDYCQAERVFYHEPRGTYLGVIGQLTPAAAS